MFFALLTLNKKNPLAHVAQKEATGRLDAGGETTGAYSFCML